MLNPKMQEKCENKENFVTFARPNKFLNVCCS